MSGGTHTVKSGDTLGAIAAANGTTVEAILAENPTIADRNLIHINQVIKLPSAEQASSAILLPKSQMVTAQTTPQSLPTPERQLQIASLREQLHALLANLLAAFPQAHSSDCIHACESDSDAGVGSTRSAMEPVEEAWSSDAGDEGSVAVSESVKETAMKHQWPTQANVPVFFGDRCDAVPLAAVELPYRMRYSWDSGSRVTRIKVHSKVRDSVARVFENVYAHYGADGVEELGLNVFGGCYNCRQMRNGSSWSMHAWAIAIDFDPNRNQLNWDHSQARLAKPDANKFWEFWEAEGWVSLGRAYDFDWMHVQAAR